MILRLFLILTFVFFNNGVGYIENPVLFNENFEDSFLDLNYWNYELGDGCPNLCGWGNNESQIYTKNNIFIRDKKLVLKATKRNNKYYSGRITTKDKIEFQYGTVEVKAKLPTGTGVWPAIWMLGHDIDDVFWPSCGEIDIMEYVGKTPGKIHNTLHTKGSYGQSINTQVTTIENIENEFHVYKLNWDKNKIQFSVDEKLLYTFSPQNKNKINWPFDKPFYLILNLAIGGNFGGGEIDDNIFPQEFIIDYIKIYKDSSH